MPAINVTQQKIYNTVGNRLFNNMITIRYTAKSPHCPLQINLQQLFQN